MRLFIALPLPPKITRELTNNVKNIQPYCTRGNFSDPQNYHLTLHFLGDCTAAQLINLQKLLPDLAAKHQQFTLHLDRCGTFVRGNRHILWRGIKPPYPELLYLVQDLEEKLSNLGWMAESRTFKPHLTLARQVVFTRELTKIAIKEQPLSFSVKQLALMESHLLEGKLTYTPLCLANLKH
ncbi:MAG: RNA 2',3'-cyclic phosphodiesterase [Bacillota bacterium]|jgi:2'-5' RNA ligase